MTLIEKTMVAAGLISMAVAALAVYYEWCNEHKFHPMRELLGKFRALPWYAKVFLTMFTMVFIVHGSTKTNRPPSDVVGGTNAPLPMLMIARPNMTSSGPSTCFTEAQIAVRAAVVGVRTNETHDFSMPDGAHVVERWRRRGAANERVKLGCAGETTPPRIEGEEIAVDTFGRIWTPGRVFAPLGIQLGMVPMANWAQIGAASLCWWMVTASNSTVVCWQNALLNRDTNTPVCVLAEFQDNGKFEYRYDLSSLGEGATNVFARIETTNGVEGVRLGAGVTTVRGHLLGPEDGWLQDKDNDGLSTHDEIFLHGTDPELPDTDGDGRSDGEEVWNGGDPLVGDVADAEIVERIAAGATNETAHIVSGQLESTKLWDGFVLHADPGTNELYTRTFEIDRRGGWTSFFLSGRGEDWCCDGEDTIGDWSLIGCVIDWEDDMGLSGTVSASPRNDTLYLPLGTESTRLTITLRAKALGTASAQQQVGAGRRASPSPVFLLEYSPKMEFPGGQEILGDDGNTYCVVDDLDGASFSLDESNRPCRTAAGEGEATEASFTMPSGPGVYKLPLGEPAEPDERTRLMAGTRSVPNGNGADGDRYLVIIEAWVSYGQPHYGCWHDYPYDWGWYGYWCDCEPECGCGVDGYSAVNCYIDWYDSGECEAVVEVGGVEVWRDRAYHVVWHCDHDHEDEPYCLCGCDETCQYCTCMKSDGPSQGSIRFRVGLGKDADEQKIGFVWFESDGPVRIEPQIFEVDSRPDANVSVLRNSSRVEVETHTTHGRDVVVTSLTNGVAVAVHRHGASRPFETWEVTNVSNLNSVVRLVKRDLANDILEDWTYSCAWQSGEWVWEVTDNRQDTFVSAEPLVTVEGGTNWVYGAGGRLERLTVCSNGEEITVRSFGYDDEGRLVLVDDGMNGCVTIAYDERGNISEMTGPEGTLRAAWDADGVMTNLDTSAWNGPAPNQPQPLMAPRSGVLGTPRGGETITPGSALDHYKNGNGEPMSMPFAEIDTDWLTPTEFECVRNFIRNCHGPYSYELSGNRVIATKGKQQFFLGHITVHLHGYITYLGNCNWQFEGTMTALDDRYDFNSANRGLCAEVLTAIGRALLSGSGRPFTISFTGSKPLVGSGHCNAK